MRASRTAAGRALRRALAAAAVALACVPTAAVASSDCLPGTTAAVEAAVRAVFGDEAVVTTRDVACAVTPGAVRVERAVPEPGSRTSGPVRFVLYEGDGARSRAGRLTAHVEVATPHVRTVAALDARALLSPALLVVSRDPIGRVPFAALPQPADVDGARLRRPLPAGAVVVAASIEQVAAVRSGAEVVTVARVEGVEVRGRAVAAQDGHRGEIVIVINPDSRKRLRGRVLGDALVEVLHVS